MSGGDGDDTYIVDDAGDPVTEAAGRGIDTVQSSSVSFTLGANVENLTLTGTAHQRHRQRAQQRHHRQCRRQHAGRRLPAPTAMSGGGGNDTYIVDNAGDR